MRPAHFFSLPFLALMVACAVEAPDDSGGDTGDSEAAVSTSACKLSRDAILSSTTPERRTVIARGFTWLDANVPYSQSRSYKGYRTDCSGFVSMAWQLGTSYTTADFSSGGGESHPLGSYSKLQPGDALVRRSDGSGHVVLFLGWNDSDKKGACVLEQNSTKYDMLFQVRTVASMQGIYKAIAADKLKSSGTPSDSSDESNDDPTDPDDGSESESGGGGSCSNDGQCNPGNNGSGLICSGGKCIPGCHTSVQCPGSKTCVSGQCQ